MKSTTRLRRLLRLVQLLQAGRVLDAEQLSDELGFTRRTIFRDLALLNEAGLHVVFDDHRRGYVLSHRVTLPVDQLTLSEAFSVLLVCQELGRSDVGMPFHTAALSAADKIAQRLPESVRERVKQALGGVAIRLDPRNPLTDSMANYERLLNAWIERRQVRIDYDSVMDRKQISTILRPYQLLFSRRSWYVIGRSSRDRQIRMYNIGRIRDVQLLDGAFQIPHGFSLERFLGDAWHLIREVGRRYEVIVRFDSLVAKNVAEVHWHRRQILKWRDDGSLEFQVSVEGLNEISWWILGYGDSAEVLSPPELRQLIRERVARMHARYAQSVPERGGATP